MILTDEEKRKFIRYLQEDIYDEELMISQLEKNPSLALEALAKQRKVEVMASKIVLKKLQSWTTVSIESKDVGDPK